MTKEDLLYDILTEVPHSRTITDIAQKTYMSQPYISQVIHSSEEKYGVKLINRNKLPILNFLPSPAEANSGKNQPFV